MKPVTIAAALVESDAAKAQIATLEARVKTVEGELAVALVAHNAMSARLAAWEENSAAADARLVTEEQVCVDLANRGLELAAEVEAAEQKVKELEARLAKRDEEAKAAEEEIEECRKFIVAGAAHPLVAQSTEEQFNWHGPLAFLRMAANTIKAQQEEIAALREVNGGFRG